MAGAQTTKAPPTTPPAATEPEEPKSLTQKLVEAALEVPHIEKGGRNEQQKYNYAKAEDVAAAATKALLSRGVLAEFECLESVETPITTKSGTSGLIVKAICELVVIDSATRESETRKAIGYGADYPGDKAIYKAMTGARKYAFIHLLGIDIGDDPEDTKGQPQQREAVKASATRKGSERPITANQKGVINALSGEANLTKAQASAIRVWWTAKAGKQHFDRLSTDEASGLIDAFGRDGSGAAKLITEIQEEVKKGNEVAQTLLDRIAEEESGG